MTCLAIIKRTVLFKLCLVYLTYQAGGQGGTNQSCHEEGVLWCDSGYSCYSPEFKCDLYVDCNDTSDETNCDEYKDICKRGGYECIVGGCIYSDWVCDNFDDCYDMSDEMNCDGYSDDGNGNGTDRAYSSDESTTTTTAMSTSVDYGSGSGSTTDWTSDGATRNTSTDLIIVVIMISDIISILG